MTVSKCKPTLDQTKIKEIKVKTKRSSGEGATTHHSDNRPQDQK
jgi:hypothetical protein